MYHIVRFIWNTHNLFVWRFVFDFRRDRTYINHWDVKGLANIDKAIGLIFFFMFICFLPYLFSVLVKFERTSP